MNAEKWNKLRPQVAELVGQPCLLAVPEESDEIGGEVWLHWPGDPRMAVHAVLEALVTLCLEQSDPQLAFRALVETADEAIRTGIRIRERN